MPCPSRVMTRALSEMSTILTPRRSTFAWSATAQPSTVKDLQAKSAPGGMDGRARPITETAVSFVGSANTRSPMALTQYQLPTSPMSEDPCGPVHRALTATAPR